MPVKVPKPPPEPTLSPLEQQLKLARAQNAYLHRQLAEALKNGPMAPLESTPEETLRLEVQDLRQRYATLKLHYEDAQKKIAWLGNDLAVAHTILHWDPLGTGQTTLETPAGTVDALLLRLLTLAHPDKWSQGQLAADLAHELTVAINTMREQLQQH